MKWCARVWEIFFYTDNFSSSTNLDSVLKDGVCVKSETMFHYLIATLYLYCMSTKVEIVVTFYHKEQKVQ